MAIKLGSTIINKKLLGVNSLNKIMLGVIEIFPNIGGNPPTWDPSDLFAANDDGLFYNYNVIDSLFQTINSMEPVTAGGQPIGVALDLSQKLAPGPEMLSNNDFDNGWTLFAPSTIVGTELVVNQASGATVLAQHPVSPTWILGATYEITFTISAYTSGTINATDVVATATPIGVSGVGTHVQTYVCQRADFPNTRLNSGFGGFVGTIASVSIKQVKGLSASQTTAAARPLADSRYNLVQATENFADSFWTKTNAVASKPLTVLAPDGTLTGNLLTDNATNGVHGFTRTYAFPTPNGVDMNTISVYVKQDTARYVWFNVGAGPNNWGIVFDTQLGVITEGPTPPYGDTALPPEDVGNGWWRLSLKTNYASANTAYFGLGISSDGTVAGSTYVGSGQSICVWGAQSQFGAVPTTYQWVNTPTDYNWQIAPLRAKFDGVDDNLSNTSAVTLSDNALLYGCYGISITAGAAFGMIVESGASGEDGGFYVGCTSSVLEVRFNGASGAFYYDEFSLAGFSGPIVIGVQLDRDKVTAQTAISLTINGQPQTRTTNTTTIANGTVFKPLPFFIGSRGGSSLRFNGIMQNITMIDKELTAPERTQMESWSMTQMGITP